MSLSLHRRTVMTGMVTGLGAAAAGLGTAVLAAPASADQDPGGSPQHGRDDVLIGRAPQESLHVMSFNIRMENTAETEPGEDDHWPDREPILVDLLEREQPTLLGVQEAKYGQLPAIERALPEHRMLGYGRQGGSEDEHSAIFFDPGRVLPLAWDQFWLSDTPDVIGSTTWGNRVTRIVVWARFRDQGSGAEFAMVNTHFDHESEQARISSAQAVVDLVDGGPLDGLPVIVTGDFNSPAPDAGAYEHLVVEGPMIDAWDGAQEQLTPAWGTCPGYGEPVEGGDRIDFVLSTEGVDVQRAAINGFTSAEGRYPSDHLPMQALLRLP